ncbi:MAG: hypothetical protein R3C11_03190 [Planctomycetaceae bacterium]
MPEEEVNIQQLLQDQSHFGTIEVSKLRSVIATNQYVDVRREVNALQNSVDSTPSPTELDLVKVGISSYFLGDHRKSDEYLSRIKNDAVGMFYHAWVLNALGRHEEASKNSTPLLSSVTIVLNVRSARQELLRELVSSMMPSIATQRSR